MADPVWLTEVLRAEGLIVNELPGAYNTGHGDMGNLWGFIDHHTGGEPPSNNPGYIQRHPSLGLASQLHLARDGKVTLCGVGIAYHAGAGSWAGIPKNNANPITIGVEAENNGKEGWSPPQLDAYVKINAAGLRHMKLGSDRVIGHKEWAAIQGKWDPGGLDMNFHRRNVQARIEAGNKPAPAPIVIKNEINECAGRNPWVGERKHPQEISVGVDMLGRLVAFEFAHIYFHPTVGAFAIPHADAELGTEHSGLFEAYAFYNYERGILGYPMREFTRLDHDKGKGAVQAFQGGVLYRRDGDDKGFIVYGAIGERWALEGYEKGPLGWPVSNEGVDSNGNRFQLFDNGTLMWHSSGVTKITKG